MNIETDSVKTGNKDIDTTKKKMNILVTRPDIHPEALELLNNYCNTTIWTMPYPIPRQDLIREVSGKDGIFCMLTDKIDDEILDFCGSQLKCISTMSAGYEHIDVLECKRRGIRIGYTPDVLTDATAELTLALLLATTRRLFEASREVYNGGWRSWGPNWMCGTGLKDARVGLFGFGRIGQAIAKRLVPFKPSMITYTARTTRTREAAQVHAVQVSFNEMVERSDIIIVCCALTNETKEIFNDDVFRRMKETAIFINTARGCIVHQPSLIEALKKRRIRAAGLDVTTPEPLPSDSPLLCLDNVVILPHIGSADNNTRRDMAKMAAYNLLAGLDGRNMVAELSSV